MVKIQLEMVDFYLKCLVFEGQWWSLLLEKVLDRDLLVSRTNSCVLTDLLLGISEIL